MVFFTCSYCGESVKKPSVVKHYQTKCNKREPFLTCVDCLKDFRGNEFEAHTKCLTEEERYSAKGFVPKPSHNKGERKQQAWQECMQTVLKKPSLKPDERDLIKAISKYENVPRKKAKFVNFLTNAFRQYASKNELIDRVWAEMETVCKEMSPATVVERKQHQEAKPESKSESKSASKNGSKADENSVKKDKKRKRPNEVDEKTVESTGKSDEKQKKKKQKNNEEKAVGGNNDNMISDETESNNGKKSRKRKNDEDSQTEQNNSVADEAEPGKSKKKKKLEKANENQVNEIAVKKVEEESKSKKKSKKQKNLAEGETKPNVEKGATTVAAGGDANAPKKEKKAKKSENKENKENAEQKPAGKSKKKGGEPGEKAEVEKTASKQQEKGKTEAGGEHFDWKATILQVLNQEGKNNRIQLQKLQKRVLKLHCQILNCENSEKKEKKFMKKLKEMQEVVMEKDFVVLKS